MLEFLKRKRNKRNKVYRHPCYFYTQGELTAVSWVKTFRRVDAQLPTVKEAASAFMVFGHNCEES